MNYDLDIFNYINGLAGNNLVLDYLGIFLAQYLAYILGIILITRLFIKGKNRAMNQIMFMLAIISSLVARFAVKPIIVLFIERPRPFIAFNSTHQLVSTMAFENLQSFPSGHALIFFAISTIVYFYHKKLGIFFLIASIFMGVARVFVGVHYPSDIIAGAITGVLIAYFVNLLFTNWQEKKEKNHNLRNNSIN